MTPGQLGRQLAAIAFRRGLVTSAERAELERVEEVVEVFYGRVRRLSRRIGAQP